MNDIIENNAEQPVDPVAIAMAEANAYPVSGEGDIAPEEATVFVSEDEASHAIN